MKSCATPAVRLPIASIFCAWRSAASVSRCSCISDHRRAFAAASSRVRSASAVRTCTSAAWNRLERPAATSREAAKTTIITAITTASREPSAASAAARGSTAGRMNAITLGPCGALTVATPAHRPPTTNTTNSGYGCSGGISTALHAPHSSPETSAPPAAIHSQCGAARAGWSRRLKRDHATMRTATMAAMAASQAARLACATLGASTTTVSTAFSSTTASVSGSCR